jgi:hypothetical protein
MGQRKAFALRVEPAIYDALQRWADAEMRSMNAQIEFLLRHALKQAGRLPQAGQADRPEGKNDAAEVENGE